MIIWPFKLKLNFDFLPFCLSWLILISRVWTRIHFYEIQIAFEYKGCQSLTFQIEKSTFWLFTTLTIFINFELLNMNPPSYFFIVKSYLNIKLYLKLRTNVYITYICRFLSLYLIRTIRFIPIYCFKLISYELAEKANGSIDHGLQRSKINWLNPFRPS